MKIWNHWMILDLNVACKPTTPLAVTFPSQRLLRKFLSTFAGKLMAKLIRVCAIFSDALWLRDGIILNWISALSYWNLLVRYNSSHSPSHKRPAYKMLFPLPLALLSTFCFLAPLKANAISPTLNGSFKFFKFLCFHFQTDSKHRLHFWPTYEYLLEHHRHEADRDHFWSYDEFAPHSVVTIITSVPTATTSTTAVPTSTYIETTPKASDHLIN